LLEGVAVPRRSMRSGHGTVADDVAEQGATMQLILKRQRRTTISMRKDGGLQYWGLILDHGGRVYQMKRDRK